MRGPLNRLKLLPWRPLFQAAILTALCVLLADLALSLLINNVSNTSSLIEILLTPPLGVLIFCVMAVGVGCLAVIFLERIYRPGINANSLWALVLCLAIVFLVRGLLPVPGFLFSFGYYQLVLLTVGVFWKGQPYWRSFGRW